jgi:hypothetical protein
VWPSNSKPGRADGLISKPGTVAGGALYWTVGCVGCSP